MARRRAASATHDHPTSRGLKPASRAPEPRESGFQPGRVGIRGRAGRDRRRPECSHLQAISEAPRDHDLRTTTDARGHVRSRDRDHDGRRDEIQAGQTPCSRDAGSPVPELPAVERAVLSSTRTPNRAIHLIAARGTQAPTRRPQIATRPASERDSPGLRARLGGLGARPAGGWNGLGGGGQAKVAVPVMAGAAPGTPAARSTPVSVGVPSATIGAPANDGDRRR